VKSDWEESSEEEEKKKPVASAAPVAPPKKKGTLKAKLAEKEAAKQAAAGEEDSDYFEDAALNPRDKARLDRERELKSDLDNAASLLGTATKCMSVACSCLTRADCAPCSYVCPGLSARNEPEDQGGVRGVFAADHRAGNQET
jgi:hypothetical protein